MDGLIIGFWCFAAIIGLLLWLGSLALLIIGRRDDSTFLSILGGVPFAALSVLFIVAIVRFNDTPSAAETYTKAFGFEPSADVANLQSEYDYSFDSGHIYLKFNASPQTVDRIVARGLKPSPPPFAYSSNVEPPDWWVPPSGGDFIEYYGVFGGRVFASEWERLMYDRSSQTCYFFLGGVD